MTREDNGKWEMLGGGLDHGEDPVDCLKREIKEETGLEVTYISPSPKFFITAPRLDATTYTANVIYEIKLKDLDFTPSDECQELRFFSKEDMKQAESFPNVQRLLELLYRDHDRISSRSSLLSVKIGVMKAVGDILVVNI